ncbi:hypothetical protein [Pseudomonas sp. PvP001]|uniref:hypothetical protein n=1 Tax=Pseudomonas sp. PvP001 TaxID=3158559 RepID=UPI0033919087
MPKLALEADEVCLDDWLRQLIGTLTSLKQFSEFPFDEFHRLVLGLLAELSVSFGSSTPDAGDLRATCGVAGNLEVCATALFALERYLHRFLPRETVDVESKR